MDDESHAPPNPRSAEAHTEDQGSAAERRLSRLFGSPLRFFLSSIPAFLGPALFHSRYFDPPQHGIGYGLGFFLSMFLMFFLIFGMVRMFLAGLLAGERLEQAFFGTLLGTVLWLIVFAFMYFVSDVSSSEVRKP